jgi:hypothetical protein
VQSVPPHPHRPAPPHTPRSDALTAIIAATCVMVIVAPVLIWLFG